MFAMMNPVARNHALNTDRAMPTFVQPGEDDASPTPTTTPIAEARRMEAAFSRLLREAMSQRKFGQFGILVSLQAGHVKTYQSHAVETLK